MSYSPLLRCEALQVAAGVVVIRLLRGEPYQSLLDAALAGLVGAVGIGLVAQGLDSEAE